MVRGFHMIIILEGPEAAGKTTLANKLAIQTGFTLIHRDKPKSEEEKQQMMDMYVKCIADTDKGKGYIFDRCWYSEMVYGEIMRDKSYINIDQMYHLEDLLTRKGAIIIHCTDDVAELWHRCKIRGEDYITDIETLSKIKLGFDELLQDTSHFIPVVKYKLSETTL